MIDQKHTAASDALTIARLATLTRGQYDRARHDEAAKLGWRVDTLDSEVQKARDAARVVDDGEADRPPGFSDEALALRFTAQHKDQLRYVAAWGRWLIREPAVWRFDDTMLSFSLARAICRHAAAECNEPKIATTIASAKTVAAIERLAKADRRHAATIGQWDALPWFLNTPSGVIDLRTGQMHPHRPDDYMTKMTAVAPGGDCPLWLKFLARITNNDTELQAFLQRVAGYCLTGITREHALFFGYGGGANGKGTLLNALVGLMGDYAAVASMECFTASTTERHPADLAMLRGARLVIAQETEEGRRWAEARIKALTGGDPITARFMRMDFFTFNPQFKLLLAGNHKPGLRNVDEAIRRRMNLIPFLVRIPLDERDRDLGDKLKAEWPGILKWAIAGCLDWQTNGLAPPRAVSSATDNYLEAEDAIGQWIAESCIVKGQEIGGRPITRDLHSTTAQLFGSWKKWAEQAGEFVPSMKRFSQILEGRDFVPKRQAGTGRAGFSGIEVAVWAL